MSDPNGRSGFEPVPELEDMSLFLHNLLQSSPAVAAGGGNSAVLDYRNSGGSLNFSDPGCFFDSVEKDRTEKAFCSASNGDCDAVTSSSKREEFTGSNKTFEASGAPRNLAHSSSSKRSRSAEVHNMSEKRRRSRINEKLKALQNLIPNSNKTDKASMLDEAIEYLKQLQLQVQMLTLRNGFSLHPSYVPGCPPPMQLPFDLAAGNVLPNAERAAETFTGNQTIIMQTVSATHNPNPKFPGHHIAVPSVTNNNVSGTSFGAESSFQSHFALLNHFPSAKDPCREDTRSHLPLDASCSGNNSSSGMSS